MSGTLRSFILVALGGAIGSSLRYIVAIILKNTLSEAFPWATFTVNILGCLFIGFLFSITLQNNDEFTRLFIMVGILGGFTTFSSFALESFDLFKTGKTYLAFIYVLSSNVIGLLSAYIGYSLHKLIS